MIGKMIHKYICIRYRTRCSICSRTKDYKQARVCGSDTYRFVVQVFILMLLVRTAQIAIASSQSDIKDIKDDATEDRDGFESKLNERINNKNIGNANKSTDSSLRIHTITNALGVDLISNNNTMLIAETAATEIAVKKKGQEQKLLRHEEENIASSTKLNSHSDINSGSFASTRNIINLINRDNVLLRQLREKAKHDSLESIKMHILMRLKLTKLPNITSPIPVPQNILENFYKNYNASQSWRQVGKIRSSHELDRIKTSNYNISHKLMDNLNTNSRDNINLKSNTNMQRDDFSVFKDFVEAATSPEEIDFHLSSSLGEYDDLDVTFDDDENESVLSHINSIYIFPEISRIRHNRKSDVLVFKFGDSHTDITYATMHLYIRGWDWIRSHESHVLIDFDTIPERDIIVAIHRAIRRSNTTSYTHKIKVLETHHRIPAGLGQWVKIDVMPLFTNSRNESQEILIKGVHAWMRPFIVTTDNAEKSPLTVHIEIGTKIKHRHKRSTSLDCQESDHEVRCCRYPLKVNFTHFGWHFVVAPTSFDAYFCNGECKVGYLEHYTHTHLTSLTTSATPCCSPTKMNSLSLLYFDDNHKLVYSVIPNMSVEKCSCS